jgi:drug/metabolite transporter (DMT)-like permease
VPVFLASFLRFLLASIILVPLNYCIVGQLRVPRRADIMLLMLQALFGVFLFSVCMFLGLKRTSALHAGLIMGMLPAVSALVAMLLLRERLGGRYLTGIALSVAGALVLALREGGGGALQGSLAGMLLILGAVVCEALFASIGKLAGLTMPAVTITTWMALIGTILFLPCALVEAGKVDFTAVSLHVWLLILYYAVVVTVLAFILFYAGLAKISSIAAGMHMAWVPLSAMLIAVLVLGQPFGGLELVSALCVMAAILVVSAGVGWRRPPGQA